jgi:hypothetical protein
VDSEHRLDRAGAELCCRDWRAQRTLTVALALATPVASGPLVQTGRALKDRHRMV